MKAHSNTCQLGETLSVMYSSIEMLICSYNALQFKGICGLGKEVKHATCSVPFSLCRASMSLHVRNKGDVSHFSIGQVRPESVKYLHVGRSQWNYRTSKILITTLNTQDGRAMTAELMNH